MIVCDTLQCIFMHINKTAGQSITLALQPYSLTRSTYFSGDRAKDALPSYRPTYYYHMNAKEIREILGHKKFNNYFKFTIVRNPWDKMVSMYFYNKANNLSFTDWVCQTANIQPNHRFNSSQLLWISDNGTILMDYIARYENMKTEWQNICDHLGVNIDLPWINKSNQSCYQKHYNDESREIVEKLFAPDAEYFGYEF